MVLKYKEKQPFGQIPYLDDDGFILYESRAICRYLAQKFAGSGPKLVPDPTDLTATALFEQAASVELANHDYYALGITEEKVFAPMQGRETDEKRLVKLVANFKTALEGYERILSKQKYITSDELSIVDLFHLPYGRWADTFYPEVYTEKPRFAAWWAGLKELLAWKRVLQEEADFLAQRK